MTTSKTPRKARASGFAIERTFKTTVERMWSLWTTKAGVEAWWGPEGFTTKVHSLNLRSGGVFDYEMTAVGKEQVKSLEGMGLPLTARTRNVFVEVAPPKRLAITTRVDFVPGVDPYDVTMTVEFRPVRGGTKVVFTSTRMHNAQFNGLARQGQTEQFDKLERLLAQTPEAGAAKPKTRMTLPSDREIRISRVFDAPREQVFRAHVDRKALEQWWGPREYATRVVAWDVRPGGAWRIVQRSPDAAEHGFRGVFQEVVPPERLTWTFEYEGTPGHVLTQASTFDALAGGRTRLTIRVRYANREDRDAMLASGMEWGMEQGFEKLDELLAQRFGP